MAITVHNLVLEEHNLVLEVHNLGLAVRNHGLAVHKEPVVGAANSQGGRLGQVVRLLLKSTGTLKSTKSFLTRSKDSLKPLVNNIRTSSATYILNSNIIVYEVIVPTITNAESIQFISSSTSKNLRQQQYHQIIVVASDMEHEVIKVFFDEFQGFVKTLLNLFNSPRPPQNKFTTAICKNLNMSFYYFS